MRVSQFLLDQQVPFETMVHPPAFTAQRRAKCLRLSGQQVVKCVLLAGGSRFYLALLPAIHHVDLAALAARLGGPVRLADEDEIAHFFCDCERGALTPFG